MATRSHSLYDGSFVQETTTNQHATRGGNYVNQLIAAAINLIRSALMT